MAQDLALIEPIQLPDNHRPTRMPSLPAWVGSLLDAAQLENKTVQGRYLPVMTLPGSMLPSQTQKRMMSAYCDAIESLCAQTPEASEAAEQAVLVITSKMLLALASQKNSETGSEAKGEAFMAALEDVPHWAVAEAVRGWYRGSSERTNPKHAHDFRWAPAPATLRALAIIECLRVKGRAIALRKLIAAEPRPEFTEEHCSTMRERLVDLVRGFTSSHANKCTTAQAAE